METLPKTVQTLRARADAGIHCWEAVKANTEWNCERAIIARKTERLLGELQAADWRPSSKAYDMERSGRPSRAAPC